MRLVGLGTVGVRLVGVAAEVALGDVDHRRGKLLRALGLFRLRLLVLVLALGLRRGRAVGAVDGGARLAAAVATPARAAAGPLLRRRRSLAFALGRLGLGLGLDDLGLLDGRGFRLRLRLDRLLPPGARRRLRLGRRLRLVDDRLRGRLRPLPRRLRDHLLRLDDRLYALLV